ncbi:2-amino-4-hydroxy-6-hydroxymethyldihydropteridine diphosphokinase [Geminocystis sp. NIES-3709]|uniref:2-amino-4-hydroxy-6- hydroxymethyldihydropteridine diphosphokinase n=1 Tax=Geminocystis sp. NIES-3709 TaxID=1617448 RepID=UPI0005FCA2AD|nr:2-amino-4-hydroxy-6-hydroxymethyldihydropteridine diphosphokinase [Geminocystis sp. NIES-3709]BAQ64210.1 2-amino-4-hydroxy-6-hydroxymethyldihydropteridine pyrophosphokinase [Geminocystis sp. NIES-3709]
MTNIKKFSCAIALGSNLGDSLTILNNAVNKLANTTEIEVISRSTWHKTKPIGPPQPDYLNGCISIQTTYLPQELLSYLLEIEQEFGRERKERWGARTLDLDIILYDNLVINSPNLEIPHPRMRDRVFVLMPLTEIASNWIDPITQLTVCQLLELSLKKVSESTINH